MSRIQRIETCLKSQIEFHTLQIIDESHLHRARPQTETHIKIIAVSHQFAGLTLITRHRLINQFLGEEFKTGLHALSLSLYTQDEWEKRGENAPASPPCAHKLVK